MLDLPSSSIVPELAKRFGASNVRAERTRDGVDTCWIDRDLLVSALAFAKREVDQPYSLLFDLTAIDERGREKNGDFTLVYQLMSMGRNRDVRLKVAVDQHDLRAPSSTNVWRSANWYEREVYDMFGVRFDGHPDLRRILMPETWSGHPLRRGHPARATEMGPPRMTPERRDVEDRAFARPRLDALAERTQTMVLNVGPQHPGTHGVLRIILRVDGERIVEAIPEIGFHHRGAEKMAERQTWHTFIPYTDRIDYLAGVLNNQPYVMAVERLCGIEVPERGEIIRVMLCELFRIASHLVWFGTFAQDVGAFSPVFYMFTDRERIFDIVEAICGGRMHPNWFRIGGVAQDLPEGWADMVTSFVRHMGPRLDEYDTMVMRNAIFEGRTRGVGAYTEAEAVEWGVTGPGLRACGCDWDLRKRRPYGAYEQFEFEVPTAERGDAYARAVVRVEEMRQSLRIVKQCVDCMPGGPVKAEHPQAVPPPRDRMLRDIETLIQHFLAVSWGPVVPEGEASMAVESAKGINAYYLTSDGDIHPYRARIRAASFPHLQMLSEIARGETIADLLSILGSIDFVLADVDR